MSGMADDRRARRTQVRGPARRGGGVRAQRRARRAARRSRSARAWACPAPRSATRWRRSRSWATSPIRTPAPGGSPPTSATATTWTRSRRAAASATRNGARSRATSPRRSLDLEEVLKGSVQLLSRLTQYAGLAVPPSAAEEPIVRLELIDMGPTMMILAVGQHGRVDKRVIDRPESSTLEALAEAERRVAALRGLTYTEAQARLLQLAAEEAARAPRPDARTSPRRSAGTARGGCDPRGGGWRLEPGRRGPGDAPRDPPAAVRDARARARRCSHVLQDVASVTRRARRHDRRRAPLDRRVGGLDHHRAVQGRRRDDRDDRRGGSDAHGLPVGDGVGARGRASACPSWPRSSTDSRWQRLATSTRSWASGATPRRTTSSAPTGRSPGSTTPT